MRFIKLTTGYKTYAVVAVGLVLGIIQGLDAAHVANIPIPDWVNWVLLFAGMGTTRLAVTQAAATATQNLVRLATVMLDTLSDQIAQGPPAARGPSLPRNLPNPRGGD